MGWPSVGRGEVLLASLLLISLVQESPSEAPSVNRVASCQRPSGKGYSGPLCDWNSRGLGQPPGRGSPSGTLVGDDASRARALAAAEAEEHAEAQAMGMFVMKLRGGGDDVQAETIGAEFEEGDSGLEDPEMFQAREGAIKPPWPDMQREDVEAEEKEMAKNVKDGTFILGQDMWYDDMYAGVGKNSKGVYDMHHDQEEGHEQDINRDVADEWKDRDNEEGYLGEADVETIANMYPALKARYSWYERDIPMEEREEGHRLQVGDLVVLDPRWRDKTLGNYTSNHGRLDVPPLDEVADAPFNDADGGPLYPEDVGIIMQDDNSSKPYLVKSLNSVVNKEGYPYEWTDEWWYIPEAIQKYTPLRPLGLASDSTVLVPDHFPSIKTALLNMTEGQSLLVKSGDDHRFEEVLEVGEHPMGSHPAHKNLKIKTLNMEFVEGARSWGRMILGRWASGHLKRANFIFTTLNSFRGVIECHGGPWRLDESEVRSAGGMAVRVLTEGNVTADKCGLGGFSWPISINSASDAVYMQDDARVRLTACSLDRTGRLGGCALYAQDRARAVLVDCNIFQNDHGIGYNDLVTIKMYGCRMRGNRNEAFYGGIRSLRSKLVLVGNYVDGPTWFRGRLPEYLGLKGLYPGDNIMGPIPDSRRYTVAALNLSMPVLDDRIQYRARLTIPVHWDGEHSISGV